MNPAGSLADRLALLRREHPLQRRRAAGLDWAFIDTGLVAAGKTGHPVLLWLPGALGLPETSFEYILGFRDDCRVIAPDLPAGLETLEQAAAGLAALLDELGVEQAHVHGGSFGAFLAQALLRAEPQRCDRVILSHAGPPRRSRARQTAVMDALARRLPERAARRLLRLGVYSYWPGRDAISSFWRGYFLALMDRMPLPAIQARFRLGQVYDRSRLPPWQAPGWEGRLLILQSAGDRSLPLAERLAFQALYPQAASHTFPERGHLATLENAAEQIAVIREFLAASMRLRSLSEGG